MANVLGCRPYSVNHYYNRVMQIYNTKFSHIDIFSVSLTQFKKLILESLFFEVMTF